MHEIAYILWHAWHTFILSLWNQIIHLHVLEVILHLTSRPKKGAELLWYMFYGTWHARVSVPSYLNINNGSVKVNHLHACNEPCSEVVKLACFSLSAATLTHSVIINVILIACRSTTKTVMVIARKHHHQEQQQQTKN